MGLFSTTYINRSSTTVNVDMSGVEKATYAVASATKEVAKSTQNIADAIDKGRVKLTHKRYSELKNKSLLLDSLVGWLDNYLTLILKESTQTNFLKWYNNTFQTVSGGRVPYRAMSGDRVRVDIDTNKETVDVYVDDELLPFTYPDYIPATDGEADINSDEYKALLNREVLLGKYKTLMDNIESFTYTMMFGDYKYGKFEQMSMKYSAIINALGKGKGQGYGVSYDTRFNDEFRVDKFTSKYRLVVGGDYHRKKLQLRIIK